jgi:hypothetical protein
MGTKAEKIADEQRQSKLSGIDYFMKRNPNNTLFLMTVE